MGILSRIKDRFSRWYDGEFIPHDNPPGSSVIMVGGYYKRHWSAKVASALVGFYLRHWQWVITTAIAIVALYISVLALK